MKKEKEKERKMSAGNTMALFFYMINFHHLKAEDFCVSVGV